MDIAAAFREGVELRHENIDNRCHATQAAVNPVKDEMTQHVT
jgi:hypothetical protein